MKKIIAVCCITMMLFSCISISVADERNYYSVGDAGFYEPTIEVHLLTNNKYVCIITIDWINESSESATFLTSIGVTAYQQGVELDKYYGKIRGYESNSLSKVRPGYGTTIYEIFTVTNIIDPIEVEIGPWISFSSKDVYLFTYIF